MQLDRNRGYYQDKRHKRRATVRSRFLYFALAVVAAMTSAYGSNPNDLLIYAVNIHQTPMQKWGPGYGIYLGHGFFITAAHVAGHSWWTHPKVAIGGREYPTTVVKEGSFQKIDLTLLAVKEDLLPVSLRLRRNPLCAGPLIPDTEVITVVPEGTARSRVIAPELIPRSARRFGTAIVDVARTGNSGSGVFEARRHCLLGIISRKIMQSIPASNGRPARTRDIAKYFVPSKTIQAFLPPGIRY